MTKVCPVTGLLPCPFCGTAPITFGSGERERGLMIECVYDKCAVGPHVSFYDHEAAIAAWNARPDPEAVVGTVRDILYRKFPTEVHADLLREVADEIVAALNPSPALVGDEGGER